MEGLRHPGRALEHGHYRLAQGCALRLHASNTTSASATRVNKSADLVTGISG